MNHHITIQVPQRPLPVVSFSYPSSKSPKRLVARSVRVVEFDGFTLRGFELPANDDTDSAGKYKVFHAHRIQGAIHLVLQKVAENAPIVKIENL